MKRNIHDNSNDFDTISIRLASPERILEWSHGEVTKPETINYRTQRSEKNGLFDERIFGPERDFECYCGRYKGIRYKGIVCEKCGVEVTRAVVRRERMGHIELAVPVSHIWFLKNVPSRIALVLGITASDVERVVYFAGYIVTKVSEEERARLLKELETEYKTKSKALQDEKSKEKLKEVYQSTKQEIVSVAPNTVIDDVTYGKYARKYGGLFEAGIGAEALYEIFKDVDMPALASELRERLESASATETPKLRKRLSMIDAMVSADVRPEWMFLIRIPVIPAAIRPMVALDGGRHATSDLNDLYRRVINRNNRLKKLLEIKAPSVILRNEKRILQEAVDALIDNSMRQGSSTSTALSGPARRPLKSLADNLKGKQGLFRQNLLGKRVDYSGRSVIVVGPELDLDQCGLPKHMALELFRPFVIAKLLEREYAFNIRGAGRLIDDATPEVWAILEEVIAGKYVLLNRAPTLHRLGIQAFRPVLIEGNAIQVHPLVVKAFNADFDGDQMAVHVPLSEEAQMEARDIMASDINLIGPGSGSPIISVAHQDIILGCYWVTREIAGARGEGKYFEGPNSAISAHDFGDIDIRAKIKVLPTEKEKYAVFGGKLFETTVGRLLFNGILPADYPYINAEIEKGKMATILSDIIDRYNREEIRGILDRIKAFGFKYSTYSGTTFSLDDVVVPAEKAGLIDESEKKADEVAAQYEEGLLSAEEKFRLDTEIWQKLRVDMEKLVGGTLDENGSIFTMWKSGARGDLGQITNMVGLKGLIQGSGGRTLDFPILSSSKEGLTPIEYFTTTHGSRKGLGDTALNTAHSGYLTRRLFDVSQDVVISEEDCGTKEGVRITVQNLGGIIVPLNKNIRGRYASQDIIAPDGTVLAKKGAYITHEDADRIADAGVTEAWVRSPMTCETLRGICQKCYGEDLGNGKPINLGEAVGTIAAQSIGEPATQLTMRTFHAGGTASVGGDIVQGLPRVEEIFDRRPPKNPAVISEVSGTVLEIKDDGKEKIISILPELADKKDKKASAVEYGVHFRRMPLVKVGDAVEKGDLLTDGSADLVKLFKFAGREKTQEYIIHEIGKIYELQGASISRKHIEVVIKQMFSRVKVVENGGTGFTNGDIVEIAEAILENKRVKEEGGEVAKTRPLIYGITNVALSRSSFLSSASFQNTNRILISAAIRGRTDNLTGLKENVIIGRLIPAGTGFHGGPKAQLIDKLHEKIVDNEDEE